MFFSRNLLFLCMLALTCGKASGCPEGTMVYVHNLVDDVTLTFHRDSEGRCKIVNGILSEKAYGNTPLKPATVDQDGKTKLYSSDTNTELGGIFSESFDKLTLNLPGAGKVVFVSKRKTNP